MGIRRACTVLLAAALVTVAGCSPDEPAPPSPTSPSAIAEPSVSVSTAWRASRVSVRPNWVGPESPWVWEYSDDIVVIAPRGLVALDRETGAEVWRLPLGGPVCGATPSPSEVGLVAVAVGSCPSTSRGAGSYRPAVESQGRLRRTTLKVIDLESASVVWERRVDGAPQFEIGGEVLLLVDGCHTRRFDLGSGTPLGPLGMRCPDVVAAGKGIVIATTAYAPHVWRVVEVESGRLVAEVTGPAAMTEPRRILSASPLIVLTGSTVDDQLSLVRIDESEVRALASVSTDALDGFASVADESLVLASGAAATEFSLDDGSILGETGLVGAAEWIPFARFDGNLLGFEGTLDGLNAGHGLLTLRSLEDDSVTELREFGVEGFLGETNLAVAGPKAVVIDDILLMPGHGNRGVLAYRLTTPD